MIAAVQYLRMRFWRAVHNKIVHPLGDWTGDAAWTRRAHDWTAMRCRRAGA